MGAAEPGQILVTKPLASRATESANLAFVAVDDVLVGGFDEVVKALSLERPATTRR